MGSNFAPDAAGNGEPLDNSKKGQVLAANADEAAGALNENLADGRNVAQRKKLSMPARPTPRPPQRKKKGHRITPVPWHAVRDSNS